MDIPICQVDAFTDEPFRGNPAGVCIVARACTDRWMQAVAAEMNLSETAFVLQTDEGFDIRFFTPVAEVPLCGHASLGAAHLLWEERIAPRNGPIRFRAPQDTFLVHYDRPSIRLDLPARPATPAPLPPALTGLLGVEPRRAAATPGPGWLAELASAHDVRAVAPEPTRLVREGFGRLLITAPADPVRDVGFDFVSRFFAPTVGVAEDPVSGVAHTTLGPWWAERLGRERLRARQVSRRGGEVDLHVSDGQVSISGRAVTVMRGRLMMEAVPYRA